MKKHFIFFALILSSLIYSQVGINTESPKATLDIAVNLKDPLKPDGIIPPRLKGSDLKNKDALYGPDQKGTIVYVTETFPVSDTTPKTINITKVGYYYFDGVVWKSFNSDTLENVVVRGNYSPKYISFIGSTILPLRDGALGMNENTYSMYFGNMNPMQTGFYNLGFGYGSLENITIATYTTAVGSFSGQKTTTGSCNTFFGDEAGTNNTTGHKNAIVGMAAAYHNSEGSFNSILGYKAGQFRNLGNYNILVGNSAGSSSGTKPVTNLGSNNVFIGAGAGFGEINPSNKLIIDSNNSLSATDSNSLTNEGVFTNTYTSSLALALVTGDFVEKWFRINGRFQINPSKISNSTNSYTKILVFNPIDGEVGIKDNNTINTLPIPPETGNYILKSINGAVQWVLTAD